MEKTKKKIIMVVGIVVALLAIIFADKAFKNNRSEDKDKAENKTGNVLEINPETQNSQETDVSADATNKQNEEVHATDSGNETEVDDKNEADVKSEKEGVYEYWLAAQTVTAVTMKYFDFELEGIYIGGETPLNTPGKSMGVCVIFKSGGESLAVKASYIGVEREAKGTVDTSSQNIGLATFDVEPASNVNIDNMTKIEVDHISTHISKLILVTLYER